MTATIESIISKLATLTFTDAEGNPRRRAVTLAELGGKRAGDTVEIEDYSEGLRNG